MRSARAIFVKQMQNTLKNPMMIVQYIIYPVVALVMTELIAKTNKDIPANMFVTMMASIFVGMALILSAAGAIAEDIENKSLRFLVMAGVKPQEYLFGTGGFILLVGVVVAVIFGLIGSFTGAELAKFFTVMVLAAAASVLLGASIGLFAKKQQTATAVATPLAVILGFTPMVATFNKTVEKAASVLYTQQLNVMVNDFTANFTHALWVMGINIAVLLVLFIVAYRKNGLKG